MNTRQDFSGTGVAIVTPFSAYTFDHEALARLVEHVVTGGVEYIVALGSTGENSMLSDEERREFLDAVISAVDGRVPVVAGNFGGSDTAALCNYTRTFNFDGIAGILSSSPAYVKPTQQGIYRHYCELASVSPVPVILYNVPGRTASNVLPETVLRIAEECPNIVAVKEASANLVQCSEIIRHRPDGFRVLSGDDPTAIHTILAGGDGVISVIANAFPREFSDMTRAALQGDNKQARRLHERLLDLHPLLYVEGNPAGIKGALSILGLCNDEVRLPLTNLSDKTKSSLKALIDAL